MCLRLVYDDADAARQPWWLNEKKNAISTLFFLVLSLFLSQGDGVRVIHSSPIEHYAQTIVNASNSNNAIQEGKGTKRIVVDESNGDEDEEEEEEIEETIITKTKKTTKKKKGEKKTYVR